MTMSPMHHFGKAATFIALATVASACVLPGTEGFGEEQEQEQELECTDPSFGETISSTSGLENGRGFVNIGRVWGSDLSELTFEWSNGATGPRISDLEPGIYTATITDPNGCVATEEFDLTLDDTGSGSSEWRVGDIGPAGGIVFVLNEDGSGLETAPFSTIWTGKAWGCEGVEFPTSHTDGQANTRMIVEGCPEEDIAARLCDSLEVNGFDDWYLPSEQEMGDMTYAFYTHDISNLTAGDYWTSSEVIATMAYKVYLPDGGGGPLSKDMELNVIAVRAFSE